MRDYELVVVLSPDLTSTKKNKLIAKIKKMVTDLKGKSIEAKDWGVKELAYPVAGKKKGYFHFWHLQLEQNSPASIDEKMKLENDVLRYLLVKIEKETKANKSVKPKRKTRKSKGGEKKKS